MHVALYVLFVCWHLNTENKKLRRLFDINVSTLDCMQLQDYTDVSDSVLKSKEGSV